MPATAFVDQYKVLGISRNASREGIVAAHRQIARENAAGQLGLGDEAELRLKQANAARTILLRDRARHDRQLAQHEAHLAAIRTGGAEKTIFQAGAVTYPRRTRPQPMRRPAQRVFDRTGLRGLERANQTAATQASSSQAQQGTRSAATTSWTTPQLRPVFMPAGHGF